MRFFQSLLPQFAETQTAIFGMSTDASAPQQAFAKHCSLTFPLISDHPTFHMAKAFGVYNEERMVNARVAFVIDKQGVIRHVTEVNTDMERYGREALEVVKKL